MSELRLICRTGTLDALNCTTIGGCDARRHQRPDRIGRRDDLRDGEVEIDVRLKVNLLDGQAVERLGLHILDAVDVGADRILAVGGDALFHLRRADSPVYCQITVTTGMLISGKISVGMVLIAVTPRNTISAANT